MDYKTLKHEAFKMSAFSLTSFVTGKSQELVIKKDSSFVAADLIQAARDGEIDRVHQQIHSLGRDKKKLNMKHSDQMAALHYAIRYGHLEIVKLLVMNGADVNLAGEGGATPLHYAARYVAKSTKISKSNPLLNGTNPRETKGRKGGSTRTLRGVISKAMRKRSVPNLMKRLSRQDSNGLEANGGFRMNNLSRSETAQASLAMLATGGTEDTSTSTLERGVKRHRKSNSLFELSSILKEETLPTNFEGARPPRPRKSNSSLELSSILKEETVATNLEGARPPRPRKCNSTLELSSMLKEENENVNEIEYLDMGSLWKQHRLLQNHSFEYRYSEDKTSVQKERRLTISSSTHVDNDAIILNIDALILSHVRQEDPHTHKKDKVVVQRSKSNPHSSNFVAPKPHGRARSASREDLYSYDSDASTPCAQLQQTSLRSSVGSFQNCPVVTGNGFSSLGNSDDEIFAEEESIISYLLQNKANVNAKDSFGSTPLHYAAMKGNNKAVRQLLSHRREMYLEAKDRARMTALQLAASHGSLQVCRMLLDAGCNTRSPDDSDMSALHFAAMEGHISVARLLVAHAKFNGCISMSTDNNTALQLAVENGHFDLVKFFIEKGADVNFAKENSITLLHLACRYGQLDIVKVLVNSGSDINAKDASMVIPLHTATSFNRCDVIKYLLDMGAKVDCCDKEKQTALMTASRKGYVDIVTLLLERNADVTISDVDDRSCLHMAADEGCVSVCQVLLDNYTSKQMIDECDKHDNTPLHVAASKGHVRIVEMLLNANACVDTKNDAHFTPLHLASQHGMSRIVEILVEHNYAIVNDEDDAANTPLHLAALEGHTEVVQLLLNSGAAVDARNAMLWCPLDCAAAHGWTKCAEYLLDAGSLIEPVDKVKPTPLHLASGAGHLAMIKLLISRKADVTRKDHMGGNCLDWALDNKQKDSAIAILESEHWESVLRSSTIEGNKVLTPMRKMIKDLPEVAELVFDKCIISNGFPKEHPSHEVTCHYEYLDDAFSDWGPSNKRITSLKSDNQDTSTKTEKDLAVNQTCMKIPNMFKKSNEIRADNPLRYMVQYRQSKLLSHQLINYLLRYKWRTYGRFVYYTHLLLYLFYLMFITGFALTINKDDYDLICSEDEDNITTCDCKMNTSLPSYMTPNPTTRFIFEERGRPVTIALTVLLLSFEMFKLTTAVRNNATFFCFLKLMSYVLSVMYVLPSCSSDSTVLWRNWRCRYPNRSLGAITVWLAWINLVMFMRVFPKLGIYIVMLSEIMKTFFQCFPVLFLFIVAFGLAFHILLYDETISPTISTIQYRTPQRSFMETFMGMVSYFAFDQVFNDEMYRPKGVAWVLFVFYIIINCIMLMNMLVGLAVDDIKGVQEQAALKVISMQVEHTLDVEKMLPVSYQSKCVKLEEHIVVDNEGWWRSLWNTRTPQSGNTLTQIDNIELIIKQQEEIRALRHEISDLKLALNSRNRRSVNN